MNYIYYMYKSTEYRTDTAETIRSRDDAQFHERCCSPLLLFQLQCFTSNKKKDFLKAKAGEITGAQRILQFVAWMYYNKPISHLKAQFKLFTLFTFLYTPDYFIIINNNNRGHYLQFIVDFIQTCWVFITIRPI